MKKVNPPSPQFPYQRAVSVDTHHAQIAYTSDRINSGFELLADVPSMKLEGDWLKEAGFKCNRNVVVTVSKDCLMITPEPKNQRPK